VSSTSPRQIIEYTRQGAAINGAAPAILAEGRKALSYDELLDQIEHAARILRASGIKADDRIVIVGSSGPEMVGLVLAVMSIAGCAPINPLYTATELEFYLRDICARLVITEGASSPVRDVAKRLGIPTLDIVADGRTAGRFTFADVHEIRADVRFAGEDHIALLLHTSGTTARPKLVPLTQGKLCSSAINVVRSLALSPNDCCLCVMPLFHIHGLIGAVLATIASGGSLACTGLFRPPAFFDWIDEFDPTWYTAICRLSPRCSA
jgi:acyl-CoA synthetase (AMP-forming)/AMP-acid ligase II